MATPSFRYPVAINALNVRSKILLKPAKATTNEVTIGNARFTYQLTFDERPTKKFTLQVKLFNVATNSEYLSLTLTKKPEPPDYQSTERTPVKVEKIVNQSSGVEQLYALWNVKKMLYIGAKSLILSGIVNERTIVEVSLEQFAGLSTQTPENAALKLGFSNVGTSTIGRQLTDMDLLFEQLPETQVQGPVCVYKLVHKQTNTQLVVFGDVHSSSEESDKCAGMPWYKWLQEKLEPTIPSNVCVDVFLETPLQTLSFGKTKPTISNPSFFQGYLFGKTTNALQDRLERSDKVQILNRNMWLHSADTREIATFYTDVEDHKQLLISEGDGPEIILERVLQDIENARTVMRVDKQWNAVNHTKFPFAKSLRERLQFDNLRSTREFVSFVVQNGDDSDDYDEYVRFYETQGKAALMDEYVIGRMLRDWDGERQTKLDAQNGRFIIMYLGRAHAVHIVNTLTRFGLFEVAPEYFGNNPNKPIWTFEEHKIAMKEKLPQCYDYSVLAPFFDFSQTNKRKRQD